MQDFNHEDFFYISFVHLLYEQIDGEYETGIHKVEFDGSELSSGVYFYQIIAADFRETKKLQILK